MFTAEQIAAAKQGTHFIQGNVATVEVAHPRRDYCYVSFKEKPGFYYINPLWTDRIMKGECRVDDGKRRPGPGALI